MTTRHSRSSAAGAGPARRRLQSERRAEGQQRVLQAAVECLAERGYARTSTVEVVRRARVSRGALLHYYRSKAELLLAALSHLLALRIAEFQAVMAEVEPGPARLDAAIALLWAMFRGPSFAAWIELRVAARTEPALADSLPALEESFYAACTRVFVDTFPEAGQAQVGPERVLRLVFSILEGAALQSLLPGDDPLGADEVVDLLRAGAHRMFSPVEVS
jgi:AcrR family transcriptional regulator